MTEDEVKKRMCPEQGWRTLLTTLDSRWRMFDGGIWLRRHPRDREIEIDVAGDRLMIYYAPDDTDEYYIVQFEDTPNEIWIAQALQRRGPVYGPFPTPEAAELAAAVIFN